MHDVLARLAPTIMAGSETAAPLRSRAASLHL